ncbi:hypothetical protein [Tunturiibacter gelidiferens]|uniref:hypothetical protein n=1 Tax=Tunturiibacter gelidiferens TaxID=3069689 RepID=UPI003D9B9B88
MTTGPQTESVQRIRPILGILGVLLGASLATFFGRLLSVGAPDQRGALIGTTYNMGLMFIGPFSVYLLSVFGIPPQPMPKPKPGQTSRSWRGFLYFSLGAASLYGAIDQGQRLDWWRSGTFVALIVSGSFLILATSVRHFSKPTIDHGRLHPHCLRRNSLPLDRRMSARS